MIDTDLHNYSRCVDRANPRHLGNLVACTYKAIVSGFNLYEKLWKEVSTNFDEINKQ